MYISTRCFIFIFALYATTISAMEEDNYQEIQGVIAPELMSKLDSWYINQYASSCIAVRKSKAFKAASFNSPKLYYLLMKQPILAVMINSRGENLLSELLRHRHHVTQSQAQFLLNCPFDLNPDLGANDSIFHRIITYLQKNLMTELLRHANFTATEKHLSFILRVISLNPNMPDKTTICWWMEILEKIKSKLKAIEK